MDDLVIADIDAIMAIEDMVEADDLSKQGLIDTIATDFILHLSLTLGPPFHQPADLLIDPTLRIHTKPLLPSH